MCIVPRRLGGGCVVLVRIGSRFWLLRGFGWLLGLGFGCLLGGFHGFQLVLGWVGSVVLLVGLIFFSFWFFLGGVEIRTLWDILDMCTDG